MIERGQEKERFRGGGRDTEERGQMGREREGKRKGEVVTCISSYKSKNHEDSTVMISSKPNCFPNVPSLNTAILVVRISTYELGAGQNSAPQARLTEAEAECLWTYTLKLTNLVIFFLL